MAVIIDTSGSVDDHSLSLFFTEIHAMWKNRAEILVIECDAEVGQTYQYRGKFPKGGERSREVLCLILLLNTCKRKGRGKPLTGASI